ncbi:unnamed protein product, partial [Porites lobata]
QSGDGEPAAKKPREEHRCDICDKIFSRLDNLKTHQLIHNGEKPYECTRCEKRFTQKSALNRHRKAHDKRAAERTFRPGSDAKKDQKTASTASEPSATPHSAPQASAVTAGSSWEADPVLIPSNLVSSSDEDIAQTYRQHWPQIRTRFRRHNRL